MAYIKKYQNYQDYPVSVAYYLSKRDHIIITHFFVNSRNKVISGIPVFFSSNLNKKGKKNCLEYFPLRNKTAKIAIDST